MQELINATTKGQVIEGQIVETEIEGENKEELIQRFEDYLVADFNEKQETEIALRHVICSMLASTWQNDFEPSQKSILNVDVNEMRCVAVSVAEKSNMYILYCFVLYKRKDGLDYKLIRKRREYTYKKNAYNKAFEWLNGFNSYQW